MSENHVKTPMTHDPYMTVNCYHQIVARLSNENSKKKHLGSSSDDNSLTAVIADCVPYSEEPFDDLEEKMVGDVAIKYLGWMIAAPSWLSLFLFLSPTSGILFASVSP
jgi:hypothetical protein